MIMLLSTGRQKRYVDSIGDRTRGERKKTKYDNSKLHFTNPYTMQRQPFTFEFSTWYANYCLNPSPQRPKWAKKFRRRFRMHYNLFLDIYHQCDDDDLFERWCSRKKAHKYNKRKAIPLKLLVLCALRYLGRGWTTDDLEEATAVNEETIRLFLHKFITLIMGI